ncbi:Enoyl-CoA hydratase [metagenome]|uniref:Enoyl-CoA hydratase n=1 Tax=metagenome TaxID=256318 RepID=A0A2P2C0K0_9ZZZZ
MSATPTVTLSNLPSVIGLPLGPSSWIEVDQGRIDAFAEVTEDRQWIHIDVPRAVGSHFGGTIAHGYLTLALLSAFIDEMFAVTGVRMAVNYGLNRVRFPAPVPAGARLRARGRVASVTSVENGTQAVIEVEVEAGGIGKPVCVAEMVVRGGIGKPVCVAEMVVRYLADVSPTDG